MSLLRIRIGKLASVILSIGMTVAWVSTANAQDAVRPEVGKPLQAAQEMMKANKFKDALAKVKDADKVPNKTATETYMIERVRGSAAAMVGDNDTAIQSFEAVIKSGKTSGADQLKLVEAVASAYYRQGKFPQAIEWANRYFKDGGNSTQMRTLLIQSYFQSGKYAESAKESLADVQAEEKAGRTPSEEKLQLLANSYLRQKNSVGYVATIEKMLNYYPKKSLWADVISRLQRKPGFADRLALDVFRLQLATGNLTSGADFSEMTQLALQAGFPGEAKKIVDAGYTSGALGSGPEAARQKRLKDLVDKSVAENQKVITSAQELASAQSAKDGNALSLLGYNLFTSGETAKGIMLMEEGLKMGGLKRPDDAKLRLGIALIQSGQKSKGIQILKGVQGADGASDLANLWGIFAR